MHAQLFSLINLNLKCQFLTEASFSLLLILLDIRDPLTPENFCAVRDITDDGSGSIKACLCSTDYCNNVEDAGSPFILENEIFDLDDIVKTSTTQRPQTRFQTSTTIRTTTTTRRPVTTTQRTTTGHKQREDEMSNRIIDCFIHVF